MFFLICLLIFGFVCICCFRSWFLYVLNISTGNCIVCDLFWGNVIFSFWIWLLETWFILLLCMLLLLFTKLWFSSLFLYLCLCFVEYIVMMWSFYYFLFVCKVDLLFCELPLKLIVELISFSNESSILSFCHLQLLFYALLDKLCFCFAKYFNYLILIVLIHEFFKLSLLPWNISWLFDLPLSHFYVKCMEKVIFFDLYLE